MRERLASLDAFRGFNILTMVFVNSIAGLFGGLFHTNVSRLLWPFWETGGRAGLVLKL